MKFTYGSGKRAALGIGFGFAAILTLLAGCGPKQGIDPRQPGAGEISSDGRDSRAAAEQCVSLSGTHSIMKAVTGETRAFCRIEQALVEEATLYHATADRQSTLAIQAFLRSQLPRATSSSVPNDPEEAYCVALNGQFQTFSDPTGIPQQICVFDDRSAVDAWALVEGPQADGTRALADKITRALYGTMLCTDEFIYGARIRVRDEQGKPVSGAKLKITDGPYKETLQELPGAGQGTYVGAGERPGRYLLTVQAGGFRANSESLAVEQQPCHVSPVELAITLKAQ